MCESGDGGGDASPVAASLPPERLKHEHLIGLLESQRTVLGEGVAEAADAGTLLAYRAEYSSMFRRAGALVARILRGADPATIPAQQASVFQLVLNDVTARRFGIAFPRSLRLQATRVIQ